MVGCSQRGQSWSGSGGGGGSGKVDVHDISITKYLDKSTPALAKNCCMGTHYPNAKLAIRKAGGDTPVEYLTVELKKVLVTGLNCGAGSGDDRIMEAVTLNFAEFKLTYKVQGDEGSEAGDVPIGWSMETNQEVG